MHLLSGLFIQTNWFPWYRRDGLSVLAKINIFQLITCTSPYLV